VIPQLEGGISGSLSTGLAHLLAKRWLEEHAVVQSGEPEEAHRDWYVIGFSHMPTGNCNHTIAIHPFLLRIFTGGSNRDLCKLGEAEPWLLCLPLQCEAASHTRELLLARGRPQR